MLNNIGQGDPGPTAGIAPGSKMNMKCLRILPVLFCGTTLAVFGFESAQFYDGFNGPGLDTNRWIVMKQQWGVNNGGVVPDNVVVSNGVLHLIGHGDLYAGPVHGVNKKKQRADRVTRVGAAIETADYFASGRYEVRMRLPRELGACSAIWTFHYEEAYPGTPLYGKLSQAGGLTAGNLLQIGLSSDEANSLLSDLSEELPSRPAYLRKSGDGIYYTTDYFRKHVLTVNKFNIRNGFGRKAAIFTALCNAVSLQPEGNKEDGQYLVRNQEIDIETPTALKTPSPITYGHARFNTWVGENTGEYTDNFDALDHPMNDGQFHVYRFDWHTGGADGQPPRVEFYVDDKCYQTNYTHVPTIAGRFTLGLWFPTWTGSPNFDTQSLDINWVRITPFHERGDEWAKETE